MMAVDGEAHFHEHLAFTLFRTEAFVEAADEYEAVLGCDARRDDVRSHAAESRVRAGNVLMAAGDVSAAAEQWGLGLALGPATEVAQRLTNALSQRPPGTGKLRVH